MTLTRTDDGLRRRWLWLVLLLGCLEVRPAPPAMASSGVVRAETQVHRKGTSGRSRKRVIKVPQPVLLGPRPPGQPAQSEAPPPRPLPAAARWSAQLTPLRALWLWGDDAIDLILDRSGARGAFFDEVVPGRVPGAPPLTLVFLEDPFDLMFNARPGAPYGAAQLRNFLADLHAHGLEVHLVACSHPYWSTGQGCVEKTIAGLEAFNRAGTGDTSWDGIQLAIARRPGAIWRPYAPGTVDRDYWEGLKADVARGGRLLEGRMPFGVLVGGDWPEQSGMSDLAFLRDVDYVAVLPYRRDPEGIFDRLTPWLELNTRFLIGIDLEALSALEPSPSEAMPSGAPAAGRAGVTAKSGQARGVQEVTAALDMTHAVVALTLDAAQQLVGTAPLAVSTEAPAQLPPAMGGWTECRQMERTLELIVQGMGVATPLVGFGFSGIAAYRTMPCEGP